MDIERIEKNTVHADQALILAHIQETEESDQKVLKTCYLSKAVESRNQELIDYMLREGASPNALWQLFSFENEFFPIQAPITLAIQQGNKTLVKRFCENGLDLNPEQDSPYNERVPPLITAVEEGKDDILQFLIDTGADVNQNYAGMILNLDAAEPNMHVANFVTNPLCKAIQSRNVDVVKTLLQNGADTNQELLIEEKVIPGWQNGGDFYHSPLKLAFKLEIPEIIEMLLEHGANPNNESFTKKTHILVLNPSFFKQDELDRIVEKKQLEESEELLLSPLSTVINNKDIGLAEKLIKAGADLNWAGESYDERDSDYETEKYLDYHPLILSINNGLDELLPLFVKSIEKIKIPVGDQPWVRKQLGEKGFEKEAAHLS